MSSEVKKVQNTEGTTANEAPKDDENKKEKVKKPNIFKRTWNAIKSGFKEVRDNPKATIIGAAIGTLATIGVSLYFDHQADQYIPGTLPEPDDEPETEDAVNDYVEGPADEDSDD